MLVYLVDDDEIFNYLHSEVIAGVMPEASIEVFKSGEQFLQTAKNADNGKISVPDIILLDIRMPDLDGFGVLDELAKLPSHLFSRSAIYMLSSTLDERDLEKAKGNKLVREFITKPLTLDKLREILMEN